MRKIFDEHIISGKYFEVHQDWEVLIPAFFVMAPINDTQRTSIDQFSEKELQEHVGLQAKVRKAMREVLGIEHVYFFQNEDSSHGYHLWIFPRYDWMKEQNGIKIQSVRPCMNYAKEHMSTVDGRWAVREAASKVRDYLRLH